MKTTSPLQTNSALYRLEEGIVQPLHFPPLPKGWVSEYEALSGARINDSERPINLFSILHHREDWKGEGRALIVIHGLGEHGGRYLHLPHYLQDTVELVFCPDLRGHGRSAGQRGHVDRFDLFVEDTIIAIRHLDTLLQKKFQRSEIHLLGHSLGGLIVLSTLFKTPDLPIKSATVSAPSLGIRMPVPTVKKVAAKILTHLWGTLHLHSEIDPKTLSHDPEVEAAYMADYLVHSKVTPKFFNEMQRAMANAKNRHSGISYPLQLLIPMEDPIVDSQTSIDFFEHLKHSDKCLKTYAGFFHESLNEIGKEKVIEDLKTWILTHSPNRT